MPDPLEPGDPERIGEFWLSGRLGAGGQGVVYDAYAPDGARVAVKVLHGAQESPGELRGMAAEARAAQRVASFCTARILQVRLEPPRPYIVSEHIDGLSLQAAVHGTRDRPGRLFDGDDLHRLGIGIATALTAIHRARVVHRDLKPSNVLLGPDGPRLVDFGIARVLDASSATQGGFAGTLRYMAPEVYAGATAGAEADVFAWGAIMVFAATGEHAFKGATLPEIAHSIRSHVPDLSALPGTLRPLVSDALAKDSLARPAASAILSELTGDPREGAADPADLVAAGAAEAGLRARWEPGDPALGRIAEDAYASLAPDARSLVPEVLLRFAVPGEDGSLTTRAVPSDELFDRQDAAETSALHHVVQAFGPLLTVAGGHFLLTRPAVLRAWPRLRNWLEKERDGLRTHHHVRQAAGTWADHGHRRADVLSGAHLETALRRAASGDRRPSPNRLERSLLEASRRVQSARKRRNRVIAVVLAAAMVVALTASGWALRTQRANSEEREIVASRELAEESRRYTDSPGTAALLAAAAHRIHETPESRAALLDILSRPGRGAVQGYLPNPVTVDARGHRLALGNDDGTVVVWDLEKHEQAGPPLRVLVDKEYKDDLSLSVALSPDGGTLAAAGSRGAPGISPTSPADGVKGTVRLWDLNEDKPIGDLPVPYSSSVTFAPDGKTVAVVGADGVGVWNVRPLRRVRLVPFPASFAYDPRPSDHGMVVVGPHAKTVAFEQPDGFQMRDLTTGRPMPAFSAPDAGTVALAPGGRVAATWVDETVRLWNTWTGRELDVRIPLKTEYERLQFTPDGKTLFTGTAMWDVATGARVGSIGAGADVGREVLAGSFLDKETMVTVTGDYSAEKKNAVRLWNVKVHQPYPAPLVANGDRGDLPGPNARLNGRMLAVYKSPEDAVVTADSAYWLWNTDTGKRVAGPIAPPPNSSDIGHAMAVSSDGKTLATGNTYGQVFLWSDGRWKGPLKGGPRADIKTMAFSVDGRHLVTGGGSMSQTSEPVVDGKVQLWHVRTGHKVADLGDFPQEVSSVAFSDDGRIVAAGVGAAVRLWDTGDHRERGVIDNSTGPVTALAFAPDAKTLATGANQTISLWDPASRQRRGTPITGHTGRITSLAFGARGRMLASGGDDHTAVLWDVPSHSRLGASLTGHTGAVSNVAFGRENRVLSTVDTAGTVRRWNIAMPENPTAAACDIAGRSLTRAEWARHVPAGIPYRDICG